MTAQTGFHHGGSAADIDNDGDIDLFVGGFSPFFYVNDGTGSFVASDRLFDRSIPKVFTAELIDINEDGFVDLLVGAHERQGDQTSIYWGNQSAIYTEFYRTVIPPVPSFGAVLDFDAEDFDADGDRDLVINRTRDGDDGPGKGFYQGSMVQLLENNGGLSFSDISLTHIDYPGGDSNEWFTWIRAQDFDGDGDIDFGTDDTGRGPTYLNDGTGHFILALPEPSTVILATIGLAGLAGCGWRRRG